MTDTSKNPTDIQGDSGPSLQRRRLVRGAAAIAPLVLTLRSGAVAAASCTGAKLISTLDQNPGTGAFKIENGSGLDGGETCVTSPVVCTTPAGSKISAGNINGTVEKTGSNAYCIGGTYSDGQQVAILSTMAQTSLFGSGRG